MTFLSRLTLTAVVAVTGLSLGTARAAEPDPLLPSDTTGIVYMNFRQVLDSDLMKKFALEQMKQALEGEDAQKMLKQLGLDPLKDIDRATIGFWGQGPDDMNFLAVVRGKFDPEKLFNAIKAEAGKNPDKVSLVKKGKYTLVKMANENPGPGQPKEAYAAVADEKTIVFGSKDTITVAAIEKAEKGTTKTELNRQMTALMLKMDEKATMYMCGLNTSKEVPVLPPQVGQIFDDPEKLAKQLSKIENVSVTLRITEDVGLELSAGMKSTEDASDFGDTMNDLVNKAKAFLPFIGGSQPNMKQLATELGKTLKASSKDKDVTISLKLSSKAIAAAAGKDDQ